MGSLLEKAQLFDQDHMLKPQLTPAGQALPGSCSPGRRAADLWAPWVLLSAMSVQEELRPKVHLPAKKMDLT